MMNKNLEVTLLDSNTQIFDTKHQSFKHVFKITKFLADTTKHLFFCDIWLIMYMSFQLDVNQIDGFHWLPFMMTLNMVYLFIEFLASQVKINSAKLTLAVAQFCGIFSGAFFAFSAKQNDLKELYGFANIRSTASMKFEVSMVFAIVLLALW